MLYRHRHTQSHMQTYLNNLIVVVYEFRCHSMPVNYNLSVLEMCNWVITLTLNHSWMLHGVMGPLNLDHNLQYVICHSPLCLHVLVFKEYVYSLLFSLEMKREGEEEVIFPTEGSYVIPFTLSYTQVFFIFYFCWLIGILTLSIYFRSHQGYTKISTRQISKVLQNDLFIYLFISKAVSPFLTSSFFFFVPSLAPLVSYILSLTSSIGCHPQWTSERGLRQLCLMSRPGADHMSTRHVQLITSLVFNGSVLFNCMSLRCCRCGDKGSGIRAPLAWSSAPVSCPHCSWSALPQRLLSLSWDRCITERCKNNMEQSCDCSQEITPLFFASRII